ncbi:hypothetical protein [Sphingomonas sp. BK345]|uniref:hypothetical protein n=1 Tax=Sphingomonas sp. BK345 TaxID=2586980 RepID=UPI00160B635A|nr:hypothetical protein [Sphingomonas sp. BK345]MBB3475745.1 hypothetical protein [Sphingomonas sp. BK345]
MEQPIRILLQTTIPERQDDWHIDRFSMLRAHLEGLRDPSGRRLTDVTARNRLPPGLSDPVLSDLPRQGFDQVWLFGVDEGDGLDGDDCAAISAFRRAGGGLLVARDHMDLGSSFRGLEGIGAANHFHSHNPEADPARQRRDDLDTAEILWPNYHSGANGDYQVITIEGDPHPVMLDPTSPTGTIRYLPSHPHEGSVSAPPDDRTARVIASGTSVVTGVRFNIAVAFEPEDGSGRAVAQSTFHHFTDLNWDPGCGCPSFVTEPAGRGMVDHLPAGQSVRRYVTNLTHWLSGRAPPKV